MEYTEARQGDVYIQAFDKLPEGFLAVKKSGNKTILALGEKTGHHHRFEEDHVTLYANDNGRRFIVIEGKPATLFHEEHAPITFAPGIYEVWQQQEWTDDNEPRVVAD
jgi:hypothetical protein